ncbi:hypothetical protein AAG570_007736 [Ranatra chinensis]|uniref:Reverse transcriptase domain-containing protein n=1 Tax=Ranatra chinensis TaxID=642074 RepID=A0ABD0XVP8_9HEMI
MDWTANEYEVILETDALECVKGHVRTNGREWEVSLGKPIPSRGQGGESLSATGRVRHEIVIPDNRVVYVKPRRYPRALTEVTEEEVRSVLTQGIIRNSASPYGSPLWAVPKSPDAQGKPRYRVVVNFEELNKYTRPEKYPLARLEEMLDRMNGAPVFSLLDLKAGCHQIRMHEADCEKTAFQFGRGKYEFTRMPFGSKNAPTFKRLMDKFLEGLNEDAIQIYMDDIIRFSRSEQEHGRHPHIQRVRPEGVVREIILL